MTGRTEYLSDEELEKLIAEIEQTDMVVAPPDMTENILAGITENVKRISSEHRKKEYRNYCFRVWGSVAAAIVMVFLLPELMSLQPIEQRMPDSVMQENVLFDRPPAIMEVNRNEKKMFEIFGDSDNIFGKRDRFYIFKERNGG